mmetsp:Transcript_9086/g.26489  ORF Transcript_9086/g.26489 Transcript_9086/m.26489 type:complete len:479 (-) Transcript_9086:216-1652(-)
MARPRAWPALLALLLAQLPPQRLSLGLSLRRHRRGLGSALVGVGRRRAAAPPRMIYEGRDDDDGYGGGSTAARGPQILQFRPRDFVMERFIGEAGVREVTEWEYPGAELSQARQRDPFANPKRTDQDLGVTVRYFEGRMQDDLRRVLLKEYFVSSAGNLAEKELDARVAIYQWWTRNAGSRGLPCTYLLGSLTADEAFLREDFLRGWRRTFPNRVQPPLPGNTWLVYSFPEGSSLGLLTAEMFPRLRQEVEPWDGLWPQRVADRRARFVRGIFRGALSALADCHDAGVAHGSLSPASITFAPADQRNLKDLTVQLQDFGFSTLIGAGAGAGVSDGERESISAAAMKKRSDLVKEDLYALGYAYLQLLFSSLTDSPAEDDGDVTPAGVVYDQETLRAIIEDKFKSDFKDAVRLWAAEREEWTRVCEELDGPDGEAEGWKLLHAMINCRKAAPVGTSGTLSLTFVSARNLLASPYLAVDR